MTCEQLRGTSFQYVYLATDTTQHKIWLAIWRQLRMHPIVISFRYIICVRIMSVGVEFQGTGMIYNLNYVIKYKTNVKSQSHEPT